MGIGVSVFLIAVGAILAFAIDVTTDGVNLNTIGVILMVVGFLGLAITLAMASSIWGGRRAGYVEEEVVVDAPVTRRRRTL
jgi:hypothetical protein